MRKRVWNADEAFGAEPETGRNFFMGIACNPLKSPDFGKINASKR